MLAIVIEAAIRSSVLILAIWIGLKALRIFNPHILMSTWRLVLIASLASPLMVGRPMFTLGADIPPALLVLTGDMSISSLASDLAPASAGQHGAISPHFDWRLLAASIYLLVAGWLLLRLAVGTALGWRLQISADPVYEDWTAGKDVRSSPAIKAPGTFGSTILLPEHYGTWDVLDRRAIMVHEESHVRQRDFYFVLLAAINKAVFWFNPLAWWLSSRIIYLAEVRSDAAAIADIEDRIRYAELLVRLGHGPSGSTSLAMARAETVARRVEQLLAETRLPRKIDWKARAAIIACVLPLAAISSGVVAQAPSPPTADNSAMTSDPDTIAERRLEQAQPRTEVPIDAKILDNYVGYYQRAALIFTVTRQGDQLFVQLTGQQPVQFYPESPTKFFAKIVHAQISFVTDPQRKAAALVLHQNGHEQMAKRVDKAEADRVAEQLAKRIKDGTAQPGSEAALRRTIEAIRAGQPNYDAMTPELAVATRQQLPGLQRGLEQSGQLQSISFRGVGSGGWDVYEAKYDNGLSIWRITLAPDGKIAGLLVQGGP
ncbi:MULTISPECIES: M56 family metallopeptidase [Bradyrhizobium]|uniref:M56 family metallopeptidase n=1 Tax=Bradyrhizobium elkanii TaxID=29448 RepID=UPI0006880704|nr:M56 family metallopeptidase [Bradyrhizobium elkanii]